MVIEKCSTSELARIYVNNGSVHKVRYLTDGVQLPNGSYQGVSCDRDIF